MPDDLYHRDVLLWSEQQANLLRQLARGERVNNVDWDRVVEEIEDVGISELRSVESFFTQMACPFTLDQLLNEEPEVLEALLTAPLES
jgi:hypothetical protein